MTSNWETVRLGEVFQLSNSRLGAHEDEPPVFAISKYDGVVLSSDYHDKRVASAKLDTYKVVNAEDWAYSTIHIDEGSIARNKHGFSGVVSPMYTIMKWVSTDHDPAYFELLLRSPTMLTVYSDFAQGSINRRRSLPWKTFSELQVTVPPIAGQRRIVDLIGTLDDSVEAADQSISSCDSVWTATLLSELANIEGEEVRAESMFGHVIGGSWGSPPDEEDVNVLALGPSAYADSSIYVDPAKGTKRSLSVNRAAVRSLAIGDIILERSGGSPTQPVGRVIKMGVPLDNVVPSDFMRLLRPNAEVVTTEFAFVIMWGLYRSGASLPFQKFTTGIRNLNIPDYLATTAIRIPVSFDEQNRVVNLWDGFRATRDGLATHVRSLRALRSEILTSLLYAAHTIPESYDVLLETVDA